MSDPRSFRDICEQLGEHAVEEMRRSAAAAPRLTPQQHAELAVILRRDPAQQHPVEAA